VGAPKMTNLDRFSQPLTKEFYGQSEIDEIVKQIRNEQKEEIVSDFLSSWQESVGYIPNIDFVQLSLFHLDVSDDQIQDQINKLKMVSE
jgi:hypothetical protein